AAADAFSIREVLDAFRGCVTEQREVLLEPYLSGWRGLIRVQTHLEWSICSCINKYLPQVHEAGEGGWNSMEHLRGGIFGRGKSSSATAQLQQRSPKLQEGQEGVAGAGPGATHIILFLQGLLSGEPRTSVLCTDAYNASLAAHHPWLIRKAATVAFCALPARDAFLRIMNAGPPEEAEAVLGEAVPYIADVYGITQELLAEHGLLDLP
ncbi:CPTP protein, partial [Sitta europaea]|nr:CPTP protein [Sitta europaea]